MKRILGIGGLLAAALLGSAAAQTEIQYWDFFVTQGPAMDEIITTFEAQNPGIKIVKNTIGGGPYDQSLDLAMQSDSGPDVFVQTNAPNSFVNYVKQGYFYNLSEFGDVDAFMQSFPEPEINFIEGSNIIGGNLYSAPFYGPSRPWLQLYINTDLYEQAGLIDDSGAPALPTTWTDFLENSRIIKEKTQKYGTAFSMQQSWATGWLYRVCNYSSVPFDTFSGGLDYRTGSYTFSTNPCYKELTSGLLTMVEDDLIHPAALNLSIDDEGARALFAEGEFAHLFAGDWVIAGWEQTHPDFKNYTATHVPFPEETPQGYFEAGLGGTLFGINAKTEHPEAAWEFFKFLHSPEAGEIWATTGNGTVLQTPTPYEQYAPNSAFEYVFSSADLVRVYPAPFIRKPALTEVQITLLGASPEDLLVGILSGQVTDVDAALTDLDKRKTEALELAIEDAKKAGINVSLEDFIFEDWNPQEDYVPEQSAN